MGKNNYLPTDEVEDNGGPDVLHAGERRPRMKSGGPAKGSGRGRSGRIDTAMTNRYERAGGVIDMESWKEERRPG
ncbi:unnamed protein product [Nezara viridula]|uniref:Uncharacterized protein n=1 Tax=Nezara viridula TaxID=85310 RepID=A0A9P0ML90_NEZVI|nr:unnamed protein product [Nezara viridula]